jgi:hypothetical protein
MKTHVHEPVAEVGRRVSPGHPFPFTPALSLGERETHIPRADQPTLAEFAKARATNLPLPKGEGTGEGELAIRFA